MKIKNFDDGIENLEKIAPVNLKDEKTPVSQAMAFCQSVSEILLDMNEKRLMRSLSAEERIKFQYVLKKIGCVSFNEANKKFVRKNSTMGESLEHQSIEFPLVAFRQLLSEDQENFSFSMRRLLDGGRENSLLGVWLKYQKKNPLEKV